MDLILEINDSMVLEVRLSGAAEGYVSAGKRQTGSRRVAVEAPLALPPARPSTPAPQPPVSVPAAERKSETKPIAPPAASAPAKARLADKPVPAAGPKPKSKPTPTPATAPAETAEPVDTLTPALIKLPKKHQDFYRRKLAEFEEVYPTEKARDLALQALESLVGNVTGR